MSNAADLRERMTLPEFPRSATYDPQWQIDTVMGPNVLWLAESLTQVLELRPGMRVLDLGCGMATSSIFLAKEFGVQVWATDLWIPATDNLQRIREAGVDDLVFPVHAEAHALPYADGFFDAIVSLDAYQYFGTNDLYAPTMVRLLKPGGAFGIVVPGLTHELDDGVPEHLKPYWETEFWCFHSAAWWRRHLERTGPFRIDHAEAIPDGADHWRRWEAICRDVGWPPHYPDDPNGLKMLEVDAGRTFALVRVAGHRHEVNTPNA